MLERLDRHEESIKRLWEEVKALRENQEKLWQSQEELRREMNLGFKRFEDRLTAFRNAVKEIAEKEFGRH
jgi:predicted  nucleic acid-binding Zn-ribbon protein